MKLGTWVTAGAFALETQCGVFATQDVSVKEPLDVMQAYATAGDPSAQFKLALAYQKGDGATKDIKSSVEWYRRAAASGFPEAQFNLGVLFSNGQEVPRDDKEAAKWIYAAAQNGVFEAQQTLVEFYGLGRGVEKSAAKALTWDAIARRTLQLRNGVSAGEPPTPVKLRADGAAEYVAKDGTKQWLHEDGGRETAREDGTRVIVHKDGRKIVIAANGTRETEYPNGVKERIDGSGKKTLADTKGNTRATDPDGTRTEEGAGTDSLGRSVRIQDTFSKDGQRIRRRVTRENETIEQRPDGTQTLELKTKNDRNIDVIVHLESDASGQVTKGTIKRADNGEGPKDKETWTIRRTLDLVGGMKVDVLEHFLDIGYIGREEVPGTRVVQEARNVTLAVPGRKTQEFTVYQPQSMPLQPSMPQSFPVESRSLPASPFNRGKNIPDGFEDPTAFRGVPDIAPMLASLTEAEEKARTFAGATDADLQRAKTTASAYFIPLPVAPQKAVAAPAWLREKTLSPTTLHETTLTRILDDRSKQYPLGFHSRLAISSYQWKHAETEHFVVHYLDEAEARQTMQLIEGTYTISTALLNLDPRRAPGKSHAFIFSKNAWPGFLARVGIEGQTLGTGFSASVSGFAYKTELFFSASGDDEGRNESAKTLCHEVTHAIVSRFYPGRKLPLWLNEGFADYVASRTLATKRGHSIGSYLRTEADAKMDIAKVFDRVKYGDSAADRKLAFYGNSERCVRALVEQLPLDAFPKFVNALAAGNEPSAALLYVYGKQCEDVAAFRKLVGGTP